MKKETKTQVNESPTVMEIYYVFERTEYEKMDEAHVDKQHSTITEELKLSEEIKNIIGTLQQGSRIKKQSRLLIKEESIEERDDEFNYIAPFVRITMRESQKDSQIEEEIVTKPKKRRHHIYK